MLAYHNDPQIKAGILEQLQMHREADQIVKGQYWENGKGCAVGCTIYSSNHMEYEDRFGIPVMLAKLEDRLFEGMPNDQAMEWPGRFMAAIKPGSDLSKVGWQFLWWLLTTPEVNPGITDSRVKEAVKLCADALYPLTKGLPVDASAAESAWSAARSAESAAWSAAESAWSAARSAESAAWGAAWGAARSAERSAESAAESAWSAARSAESAAESAWSAERSAESAARSAASAERSASYSRMAEKLIGLLEQAE